MIAFEMARQLEDLGREIDILVMIDQYPPEMQVAVEANDEVGAINRWPETSGTTASDAAIADEGLSELEGLVAVQRQAARSYVPGPYQGAATLFFAEHGPQAAIGLPPVEKPGRRTSREG